MALAVKHTTYQGSNYGAERVYFEVCMIGQGASAPIVQSVLVNGGPGTVPPGSAEIVSVTRSGTGIYVVTFSDAYFARIYAAAEIDDTAQIGSYATVGSWTNLQTSNPATCTIVAYNASGAAKTDVPLNTQLMLHAAFKKTFTGAAA